MNITRSLVRMTLFIAAINSATAMAQTTYAQKLGWPAQARLLILHVDDAGMSAASNRGTIKAVNEGVANSFSVMMPTPWVPQIVEFIQANPDMDAGLHLTLNAEWQHYRWGPLLGKPAAPGLVDKQGAMHSTVDQVVQHASPEEVLNEIRAQLERARTMGFEPTHLDSHMGTLFAKPEFLQAYIQLGVENKLPIMFPGGHNFYASQLYPDQVGEETLAAGKQIWQAGLVVLDDLHNTSYGWSRDNKVDNYVQAIKGLKPGVTMMIMHCTDIDEDFHLISDSYESRVGDMEAMLHPRVKQALKDENIILTTWRELQQRRNQLSQ